MAEESKSKLFPTYETVCSLILLAMRLLSVPAQMILHIKIGERYLGVTGLLALVLMGVWASLWPVEQSAFLGTLMVVLILRIVIHRVFCIHRRLRGGPPQHSRYCGRPLLGYLIPQVPEHLVKWMEPVLLIAVGGVMFPFNRALGGFILWSGAGLLGMLIVSANLAYNKLLDRIDASIDQQVTSQQFRDAQQRQ